MRLRDLDAKFVGKVNTETSSYAYLDSMDGAQGVMFQCPKCARGKEQAEEVINGKMSRFVRGAHYVICWFRNPKGVPQVPDTMRPSPGRWNAEGTGIEDLTFVGPQAASVQLTGGCNWHGFVVGGDAA